MASDLYHVADLPVRLRAVAHSIGLIVLSFVPALVFVLFVQVTVLALGLDVDLDSLSWNLASSVVQFLGFGLVVGAYLWLRDDFELVRWDFPGLRDLAWMVAGFLGLFLAATLLSAVLAALGIAAAQNQVITSGEENPALFLYMIPITILFVGPGEELLFRGVVQGLFRRAYGSILAVVLASVLFGAVHFVAMPADAGTAQIVAALGQAGALGLILGGVYEYTENIVVPIVVHGVWNATLFALNWARVTYDLVPAGA